MEEPSIKTVFLTMSLKSKDGNILVLTITLQKNPVDHERREYVTEKSFLEVPGIP